MTTTPTSTGAELTEPDSANEIEQEVEEDGEERQTLIEKGDPESGKGEKEEEEERERDISTLAPSSSFSSSSSSAENRSQMKSSRGAVSVVLCAVAFLLMENRHQILLLW
jgi:hypothetical protein